MNDDARLFPLIGSIQNDVGVGFLGNQAVAAAANGLGVRVAAMTTGYASARGGIDGRLSFAPNVVDFRQGVSFVLRQQPHVIVVGYLNRYEFVEIVAEELAGFSGIVVLDPVIGDVHGLYVSDEAAGAIRRKLVPLAQVITPNRFEALLLTDNLRNPQIDEHRLIDDLLALGPRSVSVTSWRRGGEKRSVVNLFGNAQGYTSITAPYYTAPAQNGAGDVFAAAVASFTALGAAPFIATVLASTFATLSVRLGTSYGFSSVDPVAVHGLFKPHDVYANQVKALTYASRYGVETAPIKPNLGTDPRLRAGEPAEPMSRDREISRRA